MAQDKDYNKRTLVEVCGRVDHRDEFKTNASEGLVKKNVKIELSDSSTHYFKVFYSTAELKNLFPGVPILHYNLEAREYVEETILTKDMY